MHAPRSNREKPSSAEKNTPRKPRRVEADFGTRDMAWSSISMHGLQLHNFGCGMRQSCLRQYYASVAAGGGAQLQLFEPRLATVWHDGGADRTVITPRLPITITRPSLAKSFVS